MSKPTLTGFVEIVDRSGSVKVSKVAEFKRHPAYESKFDFYKIICAPILLERHEVAAAGRAHSDPTSTTKPRFFLSVR